MSHVIKVNDETYRQLNVFAGEFRKASGRPVSMSAVVSRLLDRKNVENMKERIAIALKKRQEIAVCYLFGSMARSGKGADVDVGILLKAGAVPDTRYEGKVAVELESAGVRGADVRILNNASLRFLSQVMRYGTIVFSNDENARVEFESLTMKRFMDMKAFHDEYDSTRTKRLIS